MIITVKVIPGASKEGIENLGEAYKIRLRAPAVEGKANEALVRFLSLHFGVKRSQIEIIKGLKSRIKTVNIRGI
jgi:uncharacterized protein (TIGR00251 family)